MDRDYEGGMLEIDRFEIAEVQDENEENNNTSWIGIDMYPTRLQKIIRGPDGKRILSEDSLPLIYTEIENTNNFFTGNCPYMCPIEEFVKRSESHIR